MISAIRERQWHKALLTLVTILLSVGILAALLYSEREVLLTYDWDLTWRNLLVALLVLLAGMVLAAYIWGDIMRTLGSRVAMGLHIRYYALSQLARRLPGTVWYVAGRSYLYRPHGDSARLVDHGQRPGARHQRGVGRAADADSGRLCAGRPAALLHFWPGGLPRLAA